MKVRAVAAAVLIVVGTIGSLELSEIRNILACAIVIATAIYLCRRIDKEEV